MSRKVLVTGSRGFLGQNLVARLRENGDEVLEYTRNSTDADLKSYCEQAEIIYHLAGINRPQDPQEFITGNVDLTKKIVETLGDKQIPLVISSSIQAELDNDYGKSKKAAEDYLKQNYPLAVIHRFPNIFGKWSKPNYNSAIVTFCYNLARDLPIQINDETTKLIITYVDDVINTLVDNIDLITYEITLGELVAKLRRFSNRQTLPELDELSQKLYATYLSYLPTTEFITTPETKTDERGSFTEIWRTTKTGQFSINVAKPGFTKGNHYHHTKNEKFMVLAGQGVIRFRRLNDQEIIECPVSGDKLQVVDIPPGYIHHLENTGDQDLTFLIWSSEVFDLSRPDTFAATV